MKAITSFFTSITPRQWLIIAIIVVLLIIVIVVIRNNSKPTITTTTTVPTTSTNVFPLREGSVGEEVRRVQTKLNSLGEKLDVDGIWGPLTQATVERRFNVKEISQDFYVFAKI